MKKKVISYRKKAIDDIAEICFHIAMDNPNASFAFREALENACALLSEMPNVGVAKMFGNPRLADVRMWTIRKFEKYLIVYRVRDDELEIIRVVHGARDLPALFDE